jgi:two-component system, OmpR family, response regulator
MADPPRTPAAVGAPWRILLVEDSADDAELTTIALRDAGVHCEVHRVYAEATLRTALDEFAPHLVLCDLNLPGFDGEQALAVVRAHPCAARFVFLVGQWRDDTPPASDGLLLKDHLASLPALVRRLLEQPA